MYIESKPDGLTGLRSDWSGYVFEDRKNLDVSGSAVRVFKRRGAQGELLRVETGEQYWISGCKKDGSDSLYPNLVEIDDDIREEYWLQIRNRPELKTARSVKCTGKYSK